MIQDIVENHAIDIDGVGRVHACGKPGNPLVILLHGFMQTGASWAQIAQQLEGYHVLAPDLLGHGKTPFSREDELSLEAYVEQVNTLVAWARKNNLTGRTQSVSLVGYSLGGRVAALYASRYPENVSALILESAGLGPKNDDARAARAEKTARMIAELDRSIALDPTHPLAAFLDYWEALPLFATQAELPEATRSRVREERAANGPLALRANLSDAGQHKMDDLRPVLAHLNKPLLYIVGERDVAYTEIARDLMRTWADEHKDSLLCGTGFLQIEVMRDVGHNTHLEAPDQFAQVVRAFLMRTA